MTAMFPLLYCSKCGSRMLVGFVEYARDANDVTYGCAPCGTVETVTIPAPAGLALSHPSGVRRGTIPTTAD
jgi:hypothetical protein